MKSLFITSLFSLFCIFSSKAQVDTFHWNTLSSPQTFYIKMQLGYGNQLKHIDQYFIQDTLFLDIIFSDCSSPTSYYFWDSLIAIPSSVAMPQYNFIARYGTDSNSIDFNCSIQSRWYDTVFTHFTPVGIIESSMQAKNTIQVFPNPALHKLYIKNETANTIAQVEILNAEGRMIKKEKYTSYLDIESLASGLYFLKIQTDKGMRYAKFLKE